MLENDRIWITGAEGQLGHTLYKTLDDAARDILTTDKDVDVTDLDGIMQYADINRPDVIINCAAMTDVRTCEDEPIQAYKVNALGARNLSIASRKIGAKIIQISTDDVFGGMSQKTYTEFDTPEPVTVYGKSKLAGEGFVRELNPRHLVIRSSWIYGQSGSNFVFWVLEMARKGEPFLVPNDQVGSPTSAVELAKFIVRLLSTREYGVFHAACEGVCSRFYFAKEILRLAGMENVPIDAAVSKKTSQFFPYPSYTVLENMMMYMTEVYQMPRWEEAIREFMETLRRDTVRKEGVYEKE